ncbi:MAG: GTPase HflX [Alphaproteobacteria bacterium]
MLKNKACVIHPYFSDDKESRDITSCLAEVCGLAEAIEQEIVFSLGFLIKQIKPSTLLGKGNIDLIAQRIQDDEIKLAIINCSLSPVQQRNLEKAWNCKVIDRTALILEIFGARAKTREGILQVELAHLEYQKSRLVRSWTHLERQRGGLGFIGGPGETQIEIDRRLIGERIAKIKKQLENVKKTRELHRKSRQKVPYPVVALVGYTNAGKSTLFNYLSAANVFAKDQLFATLDPTMRLLNLPSGKKVILSDTVGFISDLPTELIMAFRATLEEVLQSNIILHIRDISHKDSIYQKKDVEQVLCNLGLQDKVEHGLIEVFNKIDLIPDDHKTEVMNIQERKYKVTAVSAITGEGIEELLKLIDSELTKEAISHNFKIPVYAGDAIAFIYKKSQVVSRLDDDEYVNLETLISLSDLQKVENFLQQKTMSYSETA